MKVFKILIPLVVVGMLLGACQSTNPGPVDITTTKYQVVVPPDSVLHCPLVKLPDTFKDNKNVASSYVGLYQNNVICHNNMVAVKKFLKDAQKTYEQ